jgi:glycosyltransferase involved in cell wall biosynthesis
MRSSLCVIPQDQRASDFKQATGAKRLAVAYNCPSLREVRSIQRRPHSPELVLWYHGSIGPKRLPKNIIRALSRARVSVRLEIAGYETLSGKGYIAHIMSLAAELGISNYVRFHGALCREQLFEQSCRADVGLVLLANDFGEPMVGASVKPFDYMACGLPLLVNGTPEWKSFFEAAGVAISCDPESADDIARAITWMHDNPEARITMGKKGQKMIRTVWNYETQFAQVIEALNGIQPAQGFGESR